MQFKNMENLSLPSTTHSELLVLSENNCNKKQSEELGEHKLFASASNIWTHFQVGSSPTLHNEDFNWALR